MESLGVYFDYKQQYHRVSFLCMVVVTTAVLLTVGSFSNLAIYADDFTILIIIQFFLGDCLYAMFWMTPLLIYTVLLRGLYERFAAINTHLRLEFLWFAFIENWNLEKNRSFLCSRLFRNRFFNKDTIKLAVCIRTRSSINTIKFVGRQHSFLTSIMDVINSFFTFQVSTVYFLIAWSSSTSNGVLFKQIIANTTTTFVQTFLSYYILYAHLFKSNSLFETSWYAAISWCSTFISFTILAIHSATRVSSEVSIQFNQKHVQFSFILIVPSGV